MAPILNNSPQLNVTYTLIESQGKVTDVVTLGNDLLLQFGFYIDPTLIAPNGYSFVVNFRLVEVASGQGFDFYFPSLGPKPQFLTLASLPKASYIDIWGWWSNGPPGLDHGGDGQYLFRPYIIVYEVPELLTFGNSFYSVAEEHYFLNEGAIV